MTKAFQKISGIHEERNRNPDGLTWSQFIEKYPECKHIAILCWHAGCYPEELRQELKNLLEGGERDALELLEAPETIVRCKDCTYRGEINCPQYYRRTELSDDYFCADGKRG